MFEEGVSFWVEPSMDQVYWFFLAFVIIGVFVFSLKLLFSYRIAHNNELDFKKKIQRVGLAGKPEESILRDLVKRYKINPTVLILSSLSQYDELAQQEIQRVCWESMDLNERIDIIEYLYSIRIQAFATDSAISGVEYLLRGDRLAHIRARPVSDNAVAPITANIENTEPGPETDPIESDTNKTPAPAVPNKTDDDLSQPATPPLFPQMDDLDSNLTMLLSDLPTEDQSTPDSLNAKPS